jgi:hypothetical protein
LHTLLKIAMCTCKCRFCMVNRKWIQSNAPGLVSQPVLKWLTHDFPIGCPFRFPSLELLPE